MFVRPAAGLSIRDPHMLDLIPAEGRDVPAVEYWHRRLRDGDVIEGTAPAAPFAAPFPAHDDAE